MSTSPIPVLLFGKSGSHVDAVVKTVQPEFESMVPSLPLMNPSKGRRPDT